MLEPHELEDEYFMLRVRVDGGALNLAQLRTIAEISTEFGRGTADITDRQNIQLHWIRVEDMPEIWRRLEAVGLQTTEACGDCPRIVLGSPVAGVSTEEVIDPTSAIDEIIERFIGDPRYSNLPRKFKSSISWLADTPYEINDISFIGVRHPVHGPGFDLWVGGGLSTNPRLAERLGVWVPARRDPGRLGGRRRDLPRLRVPAAAHPGPAEVPARRLGRRQVPGDPGEGIPGPGAGRRPVGRAAGEADRPHRSAQAARRQELRRRGPGRRPLLGSAAERARRPRGGARLGPGAAHPVPEAPGPGCRRRPGGIACRGPARDRA
nr:hypothetical protein GCM10020092_013830 [Actinoplanes digitatis]